MHPIWCSGGWEKGGTRPRVLNSQNFMQSCAKAHVRFMQGRDLCRGCTPGVAGKLRRWAAWGEEKRISVSKNVGKRNKHLGTGMLAKFPRRQSSRTATSEDGKAGWRANAWPGPAMSCQGGVGRGGALRG